MHNFFRTTTAAVTSAACPQCRDPHHLRNPDLPIIQALALQSRSARFNRTAAEIYPGANRYGRYQSYGALEIMYPGGLAGSGFSSAGYDWNKPNGTTTINLPFEKLAAHKARIDERSKLDFAGGLSFQFRKDGLNGIEGECGLYGVDFREMSNLGWGDGGVGNWGQPYYQYLSRV